MDLSQDKIDELAFIFLDYRNYKLSLSEASKACDFILNDGSLLHEYSNIDKSLNKYRTGNYLLEDCLKDIVVTNKRSPEKSISQQAQQHNSTKVLSTNLFNLSNVFNLSNNRLTIAQDKVLNVSSISNITNSDLKTLLSIILEDKLVDSCAVSNLNVLGIPYPSGTSYIINFNFAGILLISKNLNISTAPSNAKELLMNIHQSLIIDYNSSKLPGHNYNAVDFEYYWNDSFIDYDFNTGMFLSKP